MIAAINYEKSMNGGGSGSQLLKCDDGNYYVVKLIGNNQGDHVLANEMVSYYLCRILGVPVPACEIIQVPSELTDIINGKRGTNFKSGPAFGSYYINQKHKIVVPALNSTLVKKTRNVNKWVGAVLLDTIVQNEDRKGEHVLVGTEPDQSTVFYLIDHGHTLGVTRGWNSLNPGAIKVRNLYSDVQIDENEKNNLKNILNGTDIKLLIQNVMRIPLRDWGIAEEEVFALERYIEGAIQKAIELLLSN